MQLYNYATMQLCDYATMQLCNYATMQPCNHATMQLCNYATMQLCYYATMQPRLSLVLVLFNLMFILRLKHLFSKVSLARLADRED